MISDIHIGVHKDSDTWHKIALDFADWLKDELHKNNIVDLVICGDFFHTRHELELSTLQCGAEFLRKLSDFNITITTGNHCCYYRDKSEVHSLDPFKEWSNIRVIDTVEYHQSHGKKLCFCPWGVDPHTLKGSDILFGHFALVNFVMGPSKICDHGVDSSDLLRNTQMVITGHFHARQHRDYQGRQVLYLGSPMELDWGDRTADKGLTILNLETLDTVLIPNVVSPKHIKLVLSEIKEDLISSSPRLKSLVSNNIIELEIDKKAVPELIDLVMAKLSFFKPLQIRTKFNSPDVNFLSAGDMDMDMDIPDINIEDAFKEYINHMSLEASIKHEDLVVRVMEIHKTAASLV